MTEISALTDGGLIQDTDLFVVSRGGAGRRISGSRFVKTNGDGNSALVGDAILAAGQTLNSGTGNLIGGDGGANTILYTGSAALLLRNAADSATLLTITNAGAISANGTLDILGAIRQNGQQVWHAGNFDPTNYMPKSGGTFTNAVTGVCFHGTGYTAPAGASTTLGFTGGSGFVQAYDGAAFLPLRLIGSQVTLEFEGTPVGTVTAAGMAIAGTLSATGAITQNGNQVWHAGNFTPSAKADLASPALTGTPTAPTAAPGTNTTQIATTAFVAALGALKADLASPALTGTPTAPTAAKATNTTQLATTAHVKLVAADYAPLAGGATFTGQVYASAGARTSGGSYAAGQALWYTDATLGTVLTASAGSGSDFLLTSRAGAQVLDVVTNTVNLRAYGELSVAGKLSRATNFHLDIVGGKPRLTFDTNTYVEYDSATSKVRLVIGGTTVLSVTAADLKVLGDITGNTAP